jgi:hypothetical protein
MRQTLPSILTPLPGESLLGFLVRLDRVNGFDEGAVAHHLRRNTGAYSAITFASGSAFDLDLLAALTANGTDVLRDLTFLPDLGRLYGTASPSIKLLGRVRLAVCSPCWAGPMPHLKEQLLPNINGCSTHRVALRTACECGAPLSAAVGSLGACRVCGRLWAELPAEGLTGAALTQYELLIGAYRRILAPDRDPGASSAELRSARDANRAAGGQVVPVWLSSVSIERLAGLYLALGADDDLITSLREPDLRPCPNAACPNFDLAGASAITVERHCRVCGTRFKGARILSTFDIGHGQKTPSATQVRRARRRLGRWRRQLRAICADLLRDGQPITVERAFPLAEVPKNANLRAPRLGLTAIVRAAEARRQDVSAPWRYGLQGGVRAAIARRDHDWLLRWLSRDVRGPVIPPGLSRPVRNDLTSFEWLREWR